MIYDFIFIETLSNLIANLYHENPCKTAHKSEAISTTTNNFRRN